jgi:hypothetical protein
MADPRNGKKVAPEEEHPRKAFGLAAHDDSGVVSSFAFSRRLVPLSLCLRELRIYII